MRPLVFACLAFSTRAVVGPQPALAAELCVGGPGCHATIQGAVDAAEDGDTIRIGPGTFAGGILIDEDVALLGAAAAATTIKGGGPVLTIGEHLGVDPPTVSISRVTITGGLSRVGFAPGDFAGVGGGIYVPPSAGFATGARVDLDDVTVTGNRSEPATTFPFSCTPAIVCQSATPRRAGVATACAPYPSEW